MPPTCWLFDGSSTGAACPALVAWRQASVCPMVRRHLGLDKGLLPIAGGKDRREKFFQGRLREIAPAHPCQPAENTEFCQPASGDESWTRKGRCKPQVL